MAVITVLSCNAIYADETKPIPEAENVKVSELYNGVTLTSFEVSQNSSYTLNKFNIVELTKILLDKSILGSNNREDYKRKN